MTRHILPVTLLVAALAACSIQAVADPMETVARVDLDRYAGLWYEIARLPNRFQKDCSGNVTAVYSLREDGRIDVVNRCSTSGGVEKKAEGVARVVDETNPAKLKVRFAPAFLSFLPMVWGDYWIIDLGSDYGYAVVGEPSRRYLWVLAREPTLDEATYRVILERVEAQGYDPGDLLRTPQIRAPSPEGGDRGRDPA